MGSLREKMDMITKAFLQKEVKSISRDELVVGDHIYSWRKAKIYSHHGIYMGDDQVIHFMGQKPQVRNFWDKITSGSLMNHGGGKDHKVCPNCGDQSNLDGVISSCLDCFLKGGNLYRYEYSFSLVDFLYKARRGTCTIAASDPCGEVIHRATFLLLHNGFGAYHFSENNCEDFAIYCKTSKLVGKRVWFGRNGQANLLSVSGLITKVIWPPLSDAISVISDMRLKNDAGKVYVEDLVALKGKRLREKMRMITKAFLQKEVKSISRDELVVGDHIYSWRKAKIYSHHGIYMGDDQVIHFMGQKPQVRNFWDKITSGSLMNHGGGKDHKVCPNCGDQSNLDGVISSCLDCFLKGGNLYRYEYSFSLVDFLYKARRGTCTIAASDPCGEVIHRAKFLLLHNGFGAYHFLENNCEDFAIYCKTSKLDGKRVWFGRSGQANLLSVSGLITEVIWPPLSDAISVISDMRLKNGAGKVYVEDLVALKGKRLREKMRMITKAFLQKEVKSISRDELVVGDHIYSWRKAKIYSHHGIYMGDDQVIHFMGQKPQVRNFWDKITSGSLMNHGGGKDHKVCPNCGDQSNLDGVISSCLDCFLKGDNLYRYEYSFSLVDFLYKARRGTCTTAASDPCGEVIHRAKFLLLHNGFGVYHFSENNCEDFAIYCKTSKLVGKRVWFGRSGQANLLSVSGLITQVIWPPLSDAISVISDIRLMNGAGKVYVEDLVALKGKRLREKMGMITKAFLQKEVKIISRDELVVGDHIYSWRKAKIYSHHGIYMGDDQVIHFMGQKPQVRNFWDKITSGSLMNHGGGKDHKVCPNCGDQSNLDGVISSCLDCFLKGDNLYRYEYSFSLVDFLYKARRGTCTTAASDPCGEVIHRAKFLLLHNGFGVYHFSENNCEDFAIYCKTSKLVGKRVWFGRNGQANLLNVSGLITQVSWPLLNDAISVISDMRLKNGTGKVSVEDLVVRSKEA